MKNLVLFGFVLVHVGAGNEGDVDSGVSHATASFERTFLQSTHREASCGPCKCQSCCPVIVRNCAPKWVGTVIEAYGEWQGSAAVIVDWGCTKYNPCGCFVKGRVCTIKDTGFRFVIDWGDGTIDTGYMQHLGPFQSTHQYDKTHGSRSYQVTVNYCRDPGSPSKRCCDSYYRIINVDGHSGEGYAEMVASQLL